MTAAFVLAAYLVASYLWFADGLTPAVAFLALLVPPFTIGKPAIAGWIFGIIGLALSIWGARLARKSGLTTLLFIPMIVLLWITLTALLSGVSLDLWTARAVQQFGGERKYVKSVFVAYRHALCNDDWIFVHGTATKDCKPYIWSYATMSFQEVGPNTAVNVLPREWVKECAIQIVHSASTTATAI